MRNNFKIKILFIFFFCIILSFQNLFANTINFKAKNIQNINEKIIKASEDIEIITNDGIKITADYLEFDIEKKLYKIENNVQIIDDQKLISIYSNKIDYDENLNLFKSIGFTKINHENKFYLTSSDIEFYKNKNIISSNKKSILEDTNSNRLELKDFDIILNENYIKSNYANLIDKEKNIFEINNFRYQFEKEMFIGNDISLNNNKNQTDIDKNFIPRMKGRTIISNNKETIVNKAIYTNCKKTEGCVPWSLKAEKVSHDKENKIINYRNVWFEFYDKPIMYFPKFFHPDPSVKRQSGFLVPSITSAKSSGNFLSTPYFFALADNKDLTFSPRFYDDDKYLYQTEYRHLTKNSENYIDASIKNENFLLLKNDSSESHFFLNSNIEKKSSKFDFSKINLQIQSTSSNNYLKSYDLRSPLIDSQTTLNSKIEYEASNDELELNISSEIFEDLSKKKESDKYEYIFPNFEISKTYFSDNDGTLNLQNTGFNKLYDTNITETIIVNDLHYKSWDKINSINGIVTNYDIVLKNFNAESNNSKNYKNEFESNLSGIIQINSKLPLEKKGIRFNSSLTPIFALKFNPIKSKNIKNNDRIVDYNNIYSINRIGSSETLESGQSLTIGNEYSIYQNNDFQNKLFSFNIATSLSDNDNDKLPLKSSLNQKMSNIVGQVEFNPNKSINFNYDYLIDNNIGQFNYHKLKSNFKINNFITSFEFLEENNLIGKESYLSAEAKYIFDEQKEIEFKTRKNKKTNLTEYYNVIYQYKMDCLVAGIEYKKDYYSDESLKPKEEIFFSFTIMPFKNTLNLPGIDK